MGAGFGGNFGNTKGSNIPITKRSDVRYSKNKTEGYLLNKNHPQGGSKAKFMEEVLGYTKSDAKLFHKRVVESIINKIPTKSEETIYGMKQTYEIELIGKNGIKVKANVVVVIQKDTGRMTYKIVTVYPDKRGK